MSLSAKFDTSKIKARFDALAKSAEVAARPAAQAGIQVYYDEVKARVPVGQSVHHTKGKKQTFQPGNLKASIYQAYVEKESGDGAATYRVSYNKKKAFYGYFVEHGTSKMAAKPFIRPSYDARRQDAINAAREELRKRVKVGNAR